MDRLHIIEHPLLAHDLAFVRDGDTPPAAFREHVGRIASMLAYEATRDLPTSEQTVDTPLESARVRRLAAPITIVPILRAGLGFADTILRLMPEARVGHLGMFRDESSLQPVPYYQNLPRDIAQGPVLLVDPMLATGGSAAAAAGQLVKVGCRNLKMLCLIAAPEGVEHLLSAVPEVTIFAAALDRQLDDRGYICPGLGDAGDRLYGTL
jgi:uracil phosphoribosyltransferase